MKLKNKGFAVSSMLYSILLLFLMLVVGILAMLGNRKVILDKIKGEIVTDLKQMRSYGFSFEYKDILLTNTSKVSGFTFDLLDGVKVRDQNGNIIDVEITTTSTPTFDSTKNGVYTITYEAVYEGITLSEERTIEVVDPIVYAYSYTGKEQEFTAPSSGLYQTELWGAQGGTQGVKAKGGAGAYTKGTINLPRSKKLYINVGEDPGTEIKKAFGGGESGSPSADTGGNTPGTQAGSGGGATDIRLVSSSYDNFEGLKSRIMVAAAGGGNSNYGITADGGYGGALVGGKGTISKWHSGVPDERMTEPSTGGTQTSGGTIGVTSGVCESKIGTFGLAGESRQVWNSIRQAAGSGGGYYGGGGVCNNDSVISSGAGGSSFISGHDGCDAVAENSVSNNIIHTGQSVHYSGYEFNNTVMKAGNEVMPTHDGTGTMTGNEGNGYAKITPLIVENGKVATNMITDSSFENKGWDTNCLFSTDYAKYGSYSCKLEGTSGLIEIFTTNLTPITLVSNHKYYTRVEGYQEEIAGYASWTAYWPIAEPSFDTVLFGPTRTWNLYSALGDRSSFSNGSYNLRFDFNNARLEQIVYYDGALLLDLTEIYGAGNEPTKEWCDANIHYFDGIGIVPKY